MGPKGFVGPQGPPGPPGDTTKGIFYRGKEDTYNIKNIEKVCVCVCVCVCWHVCMHIIIEEWGVKRKEL